MGLMLLAMQIARVGLDNIPPATLFFIGLNVLFHFADPLHLQLHDVCIGSFYILQHLEGTDTPSTKPTES